MKKTEKKEAAGVKKSRTKLFLVALLAGAIGVAAWATSYFSNTANTASPVEGLEVPVVNDSPTSLSNKMEKELSEKIEESMSSDESLKTASTTMFRYAK